MLNENTTFAPKTPSKQFQRVYFFISIIKADVQGYPSLKYHVTEKMHDTSSFTL